MAHWFTHRVLKLPGGDFVTVWLQFRLGTHINCQFPYYAQNHHTKKQNSQRTTEEKVEEFGSDIKPFRPVFLAKCRHLFLLSIISRHLDDAGNLLQWHHNGHDGVSNHRCIDCLLNRFPSQKSNNAENVHLMTSSSWNPSSWKIRTPALINTMAATVLFKVLMKSCQHVVHVVLIFEVHLILIIRRQVVI